MFLPRRSLSRARKRGGPYVPWVRGHYCDMRGDVQTVPTYLRI